MTVAHPPQTAAAALPKAGSTIHLLGICGTAMTALAGMLQSQGYRVTGTDDHVYPPMSDHLRAMGIPFQEGYRPENIPAETALAIVGNVIQAKNPEAQAVMAQGLPYLSMAEAVKRFAIGSRYTVAVTGTHGKTTTTALGAHVLVELDADPGFLIGGIARNFESNFRLGRGDIFIIEGDEYDTAYFDKTPKFLKYTPDCLIVTSLEFDHADIYADLDAIRTQFQTLVRGLPESGLLVVCADDPEARALAALAPCPVVTYGEAEDADCRVAEWQALGEGSAFQTRWNGEQDNWHLPLPGRYNALNAAAVMIACRSRGYDRAAIARAFGTFRGVKRRQEVRGEAMGVTVLDDFAHHPTAVRLTLEGMRARYPGRRLWAVFEPRSFTARSSRFQQEFAAAFHGADQVLLARPYQSGYSAGTAPLDTAALAATIGRTGPPARSLDSTDAVLAALETDCLPGDVVLIMSNGGFDNLHERLLAVLRQREQEQQA
jgi:UDP-N-acetylmuramate: L-alanyl-gamma-D-glutamyl-meso-diaminopimelate ligase